MAVALRDVREWSEQGLEILASKEKLDSKINKKYYSKDFEYVYYAISKSSVDFNAITQSLTALNQRATGLSSSDHLKEVVRQFIASSKEFYKPTNIDEFRRLLRSNGLMPVDPEEKRRRAREEAERIRREREARQRAEQEARERERRRREEAYRRTMRIIYRIVAVVLIVVGITFGLPSYRYHHTEYKALMSDAENYVKQDKYDEALKAFSDARDRKSSKKKINAINARITEVQNMKSAKIRQLKQEIETILNTFRTTSFKYGRPENDFKTTQEKINLLKSLSDDADCKKYQKDLDKIKKRKI